jgi:hypothetical protein
MNVGACCDYRSQKPPFRITGIEGPKVASSVRAQVRFPPLESSAVILAGQPGNFWLECCDAAIRWVLLV